MPKQGKNIYQRKDGRWEGRYAKGRLDGRLQYGYVFGKTYEEAEQKLKAAFENSQKIITFADTFECVSTEWFNSLKPQLKATSATKYANILRLYLLPAFGSRPIRAITRNDILQFRHELMTAGENRNKPLAPKTVNSIISVLKNIFAYAGKEKGLQVTDTKDAFVRQPQKPMRVLSRREQTALSDYLRSDPSPCNLGILLCMYTGLRIGEVCALKWGDICVREQCLFIHSSMQRVQMNDESRKTKVVIQTPKSDCSIRKIPLPSEMLRLLIQHKKHDDAYLLTGTPYSFIEPRCMENHFKTAIRACGIKDVNFHALRHTFATRCVELGFDVKSLSEILGHSGVNITLNRYVHPSMELKQENMNRLSALLTTR